MRRSLSSASPPTHELCFDSVHRALTSLSLACVPVCPQSALCMTWLGDKIHSIREAAVANLADLTKTFGQEWSREQIVPKIVALYSHSNYLFRLTALGSAHALSEHLDVETFASSLLPVLLNGAQDPVPNIRLKAAKVLGIVGLKAGPESYRGMVRPVLESMSQDSDMDVKFFAEEAIQKLDG